MIDWLDISQLITANYLINFVQRDNLLRQKKILVELKKILKEDSNIPIKSFLICMLSSVVLAGASVFILNGYFYFRQERKLVKVFDDLIKVETYDVDFVSSLSELP